ncbi:MAG: PD-(D/E)XK nuclease family protein, partial [Nitrospirae bacterium]|nr:PD-(D/E)XK nuclease family protein [Nitrospirota bacterium]
QEFSDNQGRLFRMDRVVVDTDRVTVIDFKTGGDRTMQERHSAQIKTYMRLLKDLFPEKTIEGVVAYTDLSEVKKIR